MLTLGFFISSIIIVEVEYRKCSETFVVCHGLALLFGWLIILMPARSFSRIYTFLQLLKYIIVRDIVPFVMFYIIISVAFSTAIQAQLQLIGTESINVDDDDYVIKTLYQSMKKVLLELLIMFSGLDTNIKHVQNIGLMFVKEGYSAWLIEVLVVIYGVITMLIMANMLIAMMTTTFSDVLEKQATGWRQYQVSLLMSLKVKVILLAVYIFYCLFFFYYLTDKIYLFM